MRLFDADSTASYRLTKIAYLKLYNRLAVRKAVDLLFQAYAEKGIIQNRKPQEANQAADETETKILSPKDSTVDSVVRK